MENEINEPRHEIPDDAPGSIVVHLVGKGVLVRVPANAERARGYTEASVRALLEGRAAK